MKKGYKLAVCPAWALEGARRGEGESSAPQTPQAMSAGEFWLPFLKLARTDRSWNGLLVGSASALCQGSGAALERPCLSGHPGPGFT